MKKQTLALFVLIGLTSALAPLVRSQEQPKGSPPSTATARSEEKQKAVARAQVVPREMGFDLNKYVFIPIDKNEPSEVLNDSEIRPFVAPVAIESDWWMVLFIPKKITDGPPLCVYLDKRLDVVRGYLIGPKRSE